MLAGALLAIFGVPMAAPAQGLEMGLPVACQIGRDCFVFQVVDRDPGPGLADFQCGSLTYDGHNGVDIALSSWREMQAGVDVLAVSAGRVRAVRDGMPDRTSAADSGGDVTGRECGNGVVVEHSGGWSTQYCHMARGSVTVAAGDRVSAGQPLGRIGGSGRTEFPHLHLVVRRDGAVVDPFDGATSDSPCGVTTARDLWADEAGIAFRAGGTLSAGFLDRIPSYEAVWNHAPDRPTLSPEDEAIVFWSHHFGLRQGDVISTTIKTPKGDVLAEAQHVMPRDRASEFRAVGRKRPPAGWERGEYVAEVTVIRDGRVHVRLVRAAVM